MIHYLKKGSNFDKEIREDFLKDGWIWNGENFKLEDLVIKDKSISCKFKDNIITTYLDSDLNINGGVSWCEFVFIKRIKELKIKRNSWFKRMIIFLF